MRLLHTQLALLVPRCTLHPNDSLAMEGPLSRVKSLKKSLRQSFRRIRKSRVSGKKRAANANSKVSWGQAARVLPFQALLQPRAGCWPRVLLAPLTLSIPQQPWPLGHPDWAE